MPAFPKQINYRNPALLKLAARAPRCFCCFKPNDGTVVACHSNLLRHGKGMGRKAHDLCAFACFDCHDLIDGRRGGLDQEERAFMFLEAMYHTMVWLLGEELLIVNPKGDKLKCVPT